MPSFYTFKFFNLGYLKFINDYINIKSYEKELENIITKNIPDIIYIHEFKALLVLSSIYKKNKILFKNIKFIYDAHEIECFRNPPKVFIIKLFIEFIEIKFLKQVKAKVISVSHGICNYYSNKLKNNKNIFLIKNLPSKIRFYKDNYDITTEKNVKEVFFQDTPRDPPNSKLGIYSGILTLNRGIEEAIQLINNFPNIYLALVGSFNSKKFEARFDKLNYDRSRIKIIEHVENDLLINFIKTADFSIVPTLPITLSYYHSSPNKLHESKAANLPIFAQILPEHLIELKVNSSHPIGAVSDFFNHINLKNDFEIFLNHLNEYKHNYKFEKISYFNSPDQVKIYQKILR